MVIVLSKIKVILAGVIAVLLAAAGCWLFGPFGGKASFSQAQPDAADRLVLLIHIDDKKLYVLQDGECIKKYTIATGKSGYSSPIGNWKIVDKGINWGSGFGARWLGLNVTWGKYGIHGTNDEGRIGQAVSHGCIRLRNRDIIELYKIVRIGTPVIIRNGPYGPFGMGFKTLLPGQRGADVQAVQRRLKEMEYFHGYESGIYGEDLKVALNRFQRDRGLPVENRISHDDYLAMGFIEFD